MFLRANTTEALFFKELNTEDCPTMCKHSTKKSGQESFQSSLHIMRKEKGRIVRIVFSTWFATSKIYHGISHCFYFLFFFRFLSSHSLIFPYCHPKSLCQPYSFLHFPPSTSQLPCQILSFNHPLMPTKTWQPCQIEWQPDVYLQGNGEGW